MAEIWLKVDRPQEVGSTAYSQHPPNHHRLVCRDPHSTLGTVLRMPKCVPLRQRLRPRMRIRNRRNASCCLTPEDFCDLYLSPGHRAAVQSLLCHLSRSKYRRSCHAQTPAISVHLPHQLRTSVGMRANPFGSHLPRPDKTGSHSIIANRRRMTCRPRY